MIFSLIFLVAAYGLNFLEDFIHFHTEIFAGTKIKTVKIVHVYELVSYINQ